MANTPSFLGLPLNLRIEIYRLAELTRPCPISLSGESMRTWRNADILADAERNNYTALCTYGHTFKSTPNLNNRCFCPPLPSQILRVSRQVYSEAVRVLYGENMFWFSYQPLHAFAAFQKLSAMAWSSMKSLTIEASDLPIPDWRRFCNHMGKLITLSQLTFSLICGVDSQSEAESIGEAFQMFPTLKGCSILFTKNRKAIPALELGQVAKKWAVRSSCQVLPRGESGSPSKLNALPMEIKRLILMNVGLVCDNIIIQDGKIHSSSTCCKACIDSLIDCNCPFRGSGYSTSCTCNRLPLAMFQINKSFNDAANDILYSLNQITFLGYPCHALKFLRGQPESVFRKWKSIVFVVGGEPRGYWTVPNELDYRDCVDFVKKNFDLSQLCLTLDMRTDGDIELDDAENYLEKFTAFRHRKLVWAWDGVQGRLQRFHVLLSFDHEQEAVLEKEVMGEEYDSTKDGKPQPADRVARKAKEKVLPIR